jgi:hypothetical protein
MIEKYVTVIHALARTKQLADVPDAVSESAWLEQSFHTVLSISPSVGAFADWVVAEDGMEPEYDRETWDALGPNVAWYAAYMDVLINRRMRGEVA